MASGVEPAIDVQCDIISERPWIGGPRGRAIVQFFGTMQVSIGGNNFQTNHWIFVQLYSANPTPNPRYNFQEGEYNFNDGEWTISRNNGLLTDVVFPNIKILRTQHGDTYPIFIIKIYDGGPHNNNIRDPPDNIESLRAIAEFQRMPDKDRDCERVSGLNTYGDEQKGGASGDGNSGDGKQEQQNKMPQDDETNGADVGNMEEGTSTINMTEPDDITEGQGQKQDEDQTKEK